MKIQTYLRAVAAAMVGLVVACGGGGGGGAGVGGISGTGGVVDGGNGGGIVSSGVAYGAITAFGSVWVNGVRYNTSAAGIRIDDQPRTESDLRIGMVVRVDGSISNQIAATVVVDDAIKGRVEQVLDANRWVVMGQTVQIDAQTRFENNATAAAGDWVEVHGLVAGDGVVAASFIERKAAPAVPSYVVKGLVKNHNPAANTFQVGRLNVQYAAATRNDMPSGSWNGLQVDVKGSACAATPVCGTLTASKIEPAGVLLGSVNQAEIEGFVSAVSGSGFTLGNQTVLTNASTRYEGGVAADVLVGSKVEVEGTVSGGVLTATKVSLRDAIRLEGDVQAVNLATSTVTLMGLPGLSVQVNSNTELKGGLSAVSSLSVGNHLRVRGRLGSGNVAVATELERRSTSPDSRVILQAPVTALTAPTSLTLLGVVVNTSSVSDSDFKGVSDALLGRTAFFATVRVGTLVKVRGRLSGATVVWDEVELED
jgi:cytoskeletal protein CcmA (bactofilin family)